MPKIHPPHRPPLLLVTGHFHETRGYATNRPRGTPDWLLIATVSGAGRFGHAGGALRALPGDILLTRPDTPHDYGADDDTWELLWAHFQPRSHWLEWLNWPDAGGGNMRIQLPEPARAAVERLLLDMHGAASGPGRVAGAMAMLRLEELLLYCDRFNPLSERSKVDGRLRDAMEHAARNLRRKLSVEELAEVAGLSASRLAHLFREQLGTTPQRFVERQRLGRARQLLSFTGMSIKQIADETGFDNPFYFSLRFKRHTGKSPKAFRAEVK